MFSLKKNVPDIYVRESRDFQLMCNTYNIMQMATKFDIDSILNLTDTKLCNDIILKLLQTKLGFFSNYQIMGEDLRTLLESFPYLLRKKGTLTGIKQCIQLFFKIIDKTRAVDISVLNRTTKTTELNYSISEQIYVVNINILDKKFDVTLLTELLKYIIPAGYGIRYYFYTPNELNTTIFQTDTINIIFIKSEDNSAVKSEDNSAVKLDMKNDINHLINNINTTPVLKSSNN